MLTVVIVHNKWRLDLTFYPQFEKRGKKQLNHAVEHLIPGGCKIGPKKGLRFLVSAHVD